MCVWLTRFDASPRRADNAGAMLHRAPAIMLSLRGHAEHAAIVRVLTADHGLVAGYVRGARSSRLRPVLIAGNVVAVEWRERPGNHLASMTVELVASRAALAREPVAAAAVEWLAALTVVTLPEGHRYPLVHATLVAMLDAIAAARVARDWAGALVRYEALLLSQLGYRADLPEGDVFAQLAATGERLATDLLPGRRAEVLAARDRLVQRLRRALT